MYAGRVGIGRDQVNWGVWLTDFFWNRFTTNIFKMKLSIICSSTQNFNIKNKNKEMIVYKVYNTSGY